jgi:hypothetical protein
MAPKSGLRLKSGVQDPGHSRMEIPFLVIFNEDGEIVLEIQTLSYSYGNASPFLL